MALDAAIVAAPGVTLAAADAVATAGTTFVVVVVVAIGAFETAGLKEPSLEQVLSTFDQLVLVSSLAVAVAAGVGVVTVVVVVVVVVSVAVVEAVAVAVIVTAIVAGT